MLIVAGGDGLDFDRVGLFVGRNDLSKLFRTKAVNFGEAIMIEDDLIKTNKFDNTKEASGNK